MFTLQALMLYSDFFVKSDSSAWLFTFPIICDLHVTSCVNCITTPSVSRMRSLGCNDITSSKRGLCLLKKTWVVVLECI